MKTGITFKQIDASEAAKQKVNQKTQKVERYGLPAMECQVTLSSERHLQKAEVVIRAKNFATRAEGTTSDLYASIDKAFQKVERSIRRYSDKRVRKDRKS